MEITDYIVNAKITTEGIKKFEELVEENKKLKDSYGYLLTKTGRYSLFTEGETEKTFFVKKDFLKEFNDIIKKKTEDHFKTLSDNEIYQRFITDLYRKRFRIFLRFYLRKKFKVELSRFSILDRVKIK